MEIASYRTEDYSYSEKAFWLAVLKNKAGKELNVGAVHQVIRFGNFDLYALAGVWSNAYLQKGVRIIYE